MRTSLTVTLLAAGAGLAAGYLLARAFLPAPTATQQQQQPADREAKAAPEAPQEWTCSMHPQVRSPKPGRCPICFMDLVPVESSAGSGLDPRALQLSAEAAALAEIHTAPVERRMVAHEVRMIGKVAYDETRMAFLTAWVPGRLDRLFVDYTGVTVRPGDHMVELYSPRLFAAQQELLQAIETERRLESSPLEVLRDATAANVVSARSKLRLLGLSEAQIEEVVQRGTPDHNLVIHAPIGGVVVHKAALEGMYVDEGTQIYTIADLSKVWVMLEAYESDLAWLHYGQEVTFEVKAYPGERFFGRIAFIDPVLDDRTRTVKLRVNVANADRRLKPDMFVSAVVEAVLTPHGRVVAPELAGKWMCPMHPEVLAEGPASCTECGMDLVPVGELGFTSGSSQEEPLVIPATAPLLTGKRAVVYVRRPGDQPVFEGREIVLGPRAGDWYVVREGLELGEEVVVKGAFKLDSELQIRARPSMMSAAPGDALPGHDPAPVRQGPLASSEPFRSGLDALLRAYLEVQRALAADRSAEAAEQAPQVLLALRGLEAAPLEGRARAAWEQLQPELRAAAQALFRAEEIGAQRAAFDRLSQPLIQAVQAFGVDPATGELGVFHCPMAFDGRGADWLQRGQEAANPYFGAAMLRCGERTQVLEPRR